MHSLSVFGEACVENDTNDLNDQENVLTKATVLRFLWLDPLFALVINNEVMDLRS